MMVTVFLFVLELRDLLVLVDLFGPFARPRQIRCARVFGAHRHLVQQLRQLAASALRAGRRRIIGAHQRLEFVSAVPALVFVERHKRYRANYHTRPIGILPLIATALIVTGCRQAAPEVRASEGQLVERSRLSMGSELRLTAWTSSGEKTA